MHKYKVKMRGRRIAIAVLTVVMVLSFTFGQFVANDVTFSLSSADSSSDTAESTEATVTYSNVTGSVDTSAIQMANFSSSVMSVSDGNYETRTVIVSLEGESMLDAAGDDTVADYAATAEGRKTERNIEKAQESLLNTLSGLGISYDVVYNYTTVDNAVAIKVNTSYVSRIKNIDGVGSVVIGDTYEAMETTGDGTATSDIANATNVYATGIYDSSEHLQSYGGRGMTVAILDTGLDYTHEAFQFSLDDPTSQFYVGNDVEILTESGVADLLDNKEFNASGDVYVSSKVPFAYDYADHDADVYPSYSNHGTHVAGIIGGYASSYTDKDGNVAVDDETGETLEFYGVAPYCQLVICKVFTDDLTSEDIGGARTEDILAALEDCVTLGVDVINMSLGTTCGFSSTDDGDDEGDYMQTVYNSVAEADISLIAAASNDYSSGYGSTFGTNLTSNPDSGTVGSPSTYSSALSVASINGKESEYMVANNGSTNEYSVFFQESSDENSVDYDFLEQVLDGESSKTIYYVVIGGVGLASDYSTTVKNAMTQLQEEGKFVVALIKRGNNTFQEKVEIAMQIGFDGVIIYNNVAGEIKMTIGDVEDPVPTISVTQEAGEAMIAGATSRVGTLSLNTNYTAGPFMNNYSSWGVTSDLKLKPEITAHGGEITSSVPGGWTELSGTSMATPNVAGLTANVRNYLESTTLYGTISSYSQLTSQLMMSTATLVVDQEGLLYSPRKQGAGLASLDNIIKNTKAYLSTDSGETVTSPHGTYTGADNDLPKIELGDDDNKVGEYKLVFYINNYSDSSMSFTLKSYFMTESVSLDGYAVGEQAYYLNDDAVWTINNVNYSDGDTVTVGTGRTCIECTLKLTDEEREYLDSNFENGMYVEGFLKLASTSDDQCDLSIPFLGFYGDWEAAPMLDYDCFEIAEIEQDTSLTDEEKPSESVWATQAYTTYWNNEYVLPMGSYLYTQDEDADQIYTTEEHSSVSCYNEYYGDDDGSNYMTSYLIRGLYAGLLRNARKVTVELTDCATGEVIYEKVVYRVNKAYSSSGSVTPGYINLSLSPEELGLVENGQYHFKYLFYYYEDSVPDEDDTFEFSFYVDYTAPVLESASVRYVDYKDGNVTKQHVYLDLEIYDNHYSMAALLCRLTEDEDGDQALELCTEYTTPIYNAVKNGTTSLTIDITDLIDSSYVTQFYLELDDYALNHSVYLVDITTAKNANAASSFSLASGEDEITVARLATHTVNLTWDGTVYSAANLSNFTWTVVSGSDYAAVKNGTIVGLKAGTATVRVSNGSQSYDIKVTVTDSDTTLGYPSISFATILNAQNAPVVASGSVEVNMDQDITLKIETDPWYYLLVYDLDIVWTSYNESVAQVDENGKLTFLKEGTATIEATIKGTAYSTSVRLQVQDPFTISSYSLTKYTGNNSVVYIPADSNIMTIGDEAFKDNTTVEVVIIPSTVTTINTKAFYNCTNLKYVFFDGVRNQEVDGTSDLTLIEDYAFYGCTSLEFVDCSNCLVFSVSYYAFQDCINLKFIKGMEKIGTAYDGAFYGCLSLLGSLDSDTELVSDVMVTVDGNVDDDGFYYKYKVDYANYAVTKYDGQTGAVVSTTQMTAETFTMTNIAAALEAGTIDATKVKDITDLSSVSIIDITLADTVANFASDVSTLDLTSLHVCGSSVFAECRSLTNITTGEFTAIGDNMFAIDSNYDSQITEKFGSEYKAYASMRGLTGDVVINSSSIGDRAFYGCTKITGVTINSSVTVDIGSYAFYNCGRLGSVTLTSGTTVRSIGDSAFYNSGLESFTLTDGLQTLGGNIFTGCDSLTSLVIACDLSTVTFNGSTFNYVAGSKISVTNSNLSKDATTNIITADSGATIVLVPYGYSESTYTVANTVTKIGQYAFAAVNNDLEVTLGSGVTEIGAGAFASSHITSVNMTAATGLTTIGASAFYGSGVTSLTLPNSVTGVGSYAFAETPIATFTYTPTNDASFGNYVFADCTSLTAIALADNIKTMGSGTFYGCENLTEVTLPSVTELGQFTFFGCTNLESVTYGANAATTGDYTFYSYSYDSTSGSFTYDNYTKLTSLTLGGNTAAIGEGAFMNLTNLTSVDLKNATAIGAYAFYNCGKLATVTGLENVTSIGDYAFINDTSLTSLALTSAQTIGDYAFYGDTGVTAITIPKAKVIGDFAFAYTSAKTIEIPATLGVSTQKDESVDGLNWALSYTENSGDISYDALGDGAFAYMTSLTSFTVESGNKYYYVDANGVLYRYTVEYNETEKTYDATDESILVAYPAGKAATSCTVPEGTIKVKAYAFAGASNLSSVTFEYTVTNIGIGAFLDSGVTSYTFLSVAAPVLESEYTDSDLTILTGVNVSKYRGLYYTNFGDDFIYYLDELLVYDSNNSLTSKTSSLSITYPSNGTGYDNYVYSNYFSTKTLGAVVMTDDTRSAQAAINEIMAYLSGLGYTADDVAGWVTLDITTANTEMVFELCDMVKEAHRLYNLIKSDADQVALLTQEYVDYLLDLEESLKDVKTRFGYTVTLSSLKYDADSYKSTYIEGEKFDITGLTVTATYDDYSTEIYYADNGDITVVDPDAVLDLYDSSVDVYIADLERTLSVVVTVSEGDGSAAAGSEGGGLPGWAIALIVVGAVVVVAGAAVVVLLVLKKKKGTTPDDEILVEDESVEQNGEAGEAGPEEDSLKEQTNEAEEISAPGESPEKQSGEAEAEDADAEGKDADGE